MTLTSELQPVLDTAPFGQPRLREMSEPVRLRDGSQISVRHVCAADEAALQTFMRSLSPESRRLRFFSAASNVESSAHWAAQADGVVHLGIVALGSDGEIVGHCACVRMVGAGAEVAVEINETHRHLGLATALIARLAREAQTQQITHFFAEVLPDNRDMLDVFHDRFDASRRIAEGEVDIDFPTSAWQLAEGRGPAYSASEHPPMAGTSQAG